MNILPKKRWHVRNKDNIARVRRDEANALAEEKERIRRIQLAEQEARTQMLRERAKDRFALNEPVVDEGEEVATQSIEDEKTGHINFFKALEEGEKVNVGNKEYEEEKKKEKETYEKNIGLLTYLGQSALDAQSSPWYEKLPDSKDSAKEAEVEKALSRKLSQDPLMDIKRYLGCSGIQKLKQKSPKVTPEMPVLPIKRKKSKKDKKKKSKKSKKHKKSKDSSSESDSCKDSEPEPVTQSKSIEQLRRERIEREKMEKLRAQKLLAKVYQTEPEKEEKPQDSVKQKYNSQFNPHLAKQNFDPGMKYWLS